MMMMHPRPMQTRWTEVPKQDLAILAYASEAISTLRAVGALTIPGDRGDEGGVALTSSDDALVARGEDGDEVVLASKEEEPGVEGPRETGQAAEVGRVDVDQPGDGREHKTVSVRLSEFRSSSEDGERD